MDIYFDTAATTPLREEVRAAIQNSFAIFGNPSSLHRLGLQAEQVMEEARRTMKRQLDAPSAKFVFTASGTEANNLAIFGIANRARKNARHAVTTQIEHPSVLACFAELEARGWEVTYIAPRTSGDVSAADVLQAIRSDTALVSMMHVNNETGARLPVETVGQALRANPRVRFHVDGIQAFGKIPVSFPHIGADVYTISGHKIGAPKGIAGACVRNGLALAPFVFGGGQEYGLRSGTENVLFAHALGVACHSADHLQAEQADVDHLAQRLRRGLETIPNACLITPNVTSPYILCVVFPRLRGEVLVHAFESAGLYASSGSACSTRAHQKRVSHVLKAMGWSEADAAGAIRLSIGSWHTVADVDKALEIVAAQTAWLYRM